MTDAQALDLFEKATGMEVGGWDDPEVHEMIDSVRKVRKAKSDAEAISAIGWIGRSEEDLLSVIATIKGSA